jgi:uncharacterized Zn finger protein
MPRRNYYEDYYPKPSKPKPAAGLKAKSQRGKIGESWWADKWIKALEPLLDAGRLSRGRSYARSGQVLNLDIGPGVVTSRVQGSRATPYKVKITVKTLSAAEWSKVVDALAEQAIFAAKLLAGEMPKDVESAFSAARVSLFPTQRADLQTDCSCPDYANPCKHVAAVYYLLGERFDEDPFLLFHLRGKDKEQLLAELRQRRADDDLALAEDSPPYEVGPAQAEASAAPLEAELDRFWELREGMETFTAPVARPAVEAGLLKRLGKPPFERKPGEISDALTAAYAAVTDNALRLALGETVDENAWGMAHRLHG